MKLRTVTLGCKVNQYETEFVREGLLGVGYEDAGEDDAAELCVVNTCTVTNEGDSKSRQVIRRLARKNPGAKIVVMGCYATRAPEEVAALPGVSPRISQRCEQRGDGDGVSRRRYRPRSSFAWFSRREERGEGHSGRVLSRSPGSGVASRRLRRPDHHPPRSVLQPFSFPRQ